VRWFETNGLRHRVDEDQSLFPRLAARTPDDRVLGDALRVLAAEHADEDALVGELAAAVRALDAKLPGGLTRAREAARRLVAHFRRHMDVEDRVVLPAAAGALDADALRAIADEMERRRAEGACS
jgi:hemerythrin-like domain-containing protein